MSYGRRMIFTDAAQITIENVADEVRAAMRVHDANRTEADKLHRVYRGKTDILNKKKEIRESINHKIHEAHPYEIVAFHKGYVFGEPIQYVRRENSAEDEPDDEIAAGINALNGYMADADKSACDNDLAEWFLVCGTAYRLTLPNPDWVEGGDEPPLLVSTLDPRRTFVVYSNDVYHKPMMAVYFVRRNQRERVFSVYTEDTYFEFTEYGNVTSEGHTLGQIPITEYPADNSRLGVFEICLPLINALDELQSNRMDDVVQYVNSFLAILGGELDSETYKHLNEWKTLCLPEGTDAKYLSPAMNQNDIQTFKDDMYQTILTICGIPNRNGGTSAGDNGVAVQLRDGWQTAETRAKATELMFKRSEKHFLRLVLRILRDTVGTPLSLTDIGIHFTRRNYENIAAKAQVLTAMLSNPNIHPELSFAYCGMFVDPESAYLQSMKWREEQEKKELERNAGVGGSALPAVQKPSGGSERTGEN